MNTKQATHEVQTALHYSLSTETCLHVQYAYTQVHAHTDISITLALHAKCSLREW